MADATIGIILIWIGIVCCAAVTVYIVMKAVEGLGRMAYETI